MLDGLLGRNFSTKSKSLIKPTRTRIEVLRRRTEAKQRFLKEDLAKLLANGLDINAYGRTEEYLAGLSLLSCYDFIDKSCEYVVKQLSSMQKQSECPEECRQVVASLMFAAARFSDLPELRDLRDLFQERYGDSLECFVNQKFVERLAMRPPAMEKKLQLLQDIALDFSVKWDSKGFEQRMVNSPAVGQDQLKKYGSFNVIDDKSKLPNGMKTPAEVDKCDFPPKRKLELVNDGHRMHNGMESLDLKRDNVDLQLGRQEVAHSVHKPVPNRGGIIPKGDTDIVYLGRRQLTADTDGLSNRKEEDIALKTVRSGGSSRGKKPEWIDGGMQNDRANPASKGQSRDFFPPGKPEVAKGSAGISVWNDGEDVSSAVNDYNSENSRGRVQREEADRLKSSYNSVVPPPYVKSKDIIPPPPYTKPKDRHHEVRRSKHAGADSDGYSMEPSAYAKTNSLNSSNGKQKEPDLSNSDGPSLEPARVNSHGHDKDPYCQNDIPLPKPRSLRRKHSKSSFGHDSAGNFEDAGVVKKNSSSRRRDHSKKGLQILFDDEQRQEDEEERVIDKLLLHYSRKPSACDMEKLRKKSEYHPSHKKAVDTSESSHNQNKGGDEGKSDFVPLPSRSVSLPHEQTAPSEAKRVFTRANSFQPDNQARHVHPKLPDYDDLAAQFAALRGQ